MHSTLKCEQKILKNIQGVAIIEFVITLPIILLLIVALYDISSYIVNARKLQHTAINAIEAVSNMIDLDEDSDNAMNSDNIIKAIKATCRLLFYADKFVVEETRVSNLIMCWTMVTNIKGTATIRWRVWCRHSDKSVQDFYKGFSSDDFIVSKSDGMVECFENKSKLNSLLSSQSLRDKFFTRDGDLLYVEIFDNRKTDMYLSSCYPENFYKFYSESYQFIGNVDKMKNEN